MDERHARRSWIGCRRDALGRVRPVLVFAPDVVGAPRKDVRDRDPGALAQALPRAAPGARPAHRGRRGSSPMLRRLRPSDAGHDHACCRPGSGRPGHAAGTRRATPAQAGPAVRAGRGSAAARSRSGPCPCWRSCRCGRSSTPRPCGRRRWSSPGLGRRRGGLRPVLLVPRRGGAGWRGLPVRRRRGDQDLPRHRGAGRLRVERQPGLRRPGLRRPEPRGRPAHRLGARQRGDAGLRYAAHRRPSSSAWCATSATPWAAATRPARSSSSTALLTPRSSSRPRRPAAEVRPVKPRFEVLVVGGGPAGAATGYWLAQHGHDVLVVEKKGFPREKTCGDGLTPRAVRQLDDMGLTEQLSPFHRFGGLRATAHGKTLELTWPEHPVYPSLRLRGAPARARPARGRQRRQGRRHPVGGHRGAATDDRAGVRARRRRPAQGRPRRGGGPSPVRGRGRRCQLPLRAGAGHVAPPGVALRDRHPGLLGQPAHRRAVDRELPRREGSQRQPHARLRVDLPGGRRDGQHRRRAAVHVPRLQGRQHHQPAPRVRRHRSRLLAARARPPGGPPDQRPAPHGRLGRPEGRADAPRGRRCRRYRQSVQRRGHRLRLRDRAASPPRCSTRPSARTTRSCCSSTRSASKPSTASTSRSPACSPT